LEISIHSGEPWLEPRSAGPDRTGPDRASQRPRRDGHRRWQRPRRARHRLHRREYPLHRWRNRLHRPGRGDGGCAEDEGASAIRGSRAKVPRR